MSSSNTPTREPGITRRVKCPDCPDGQLWDSKGPTKDLCPTCCGEAFIYTTEPYDDD